MANLMRRHIVTESYCPVCKLECETTEHALWSCEAARDVWSQCRKKIQKLSLNCVSFKETWGLLSQQLQGEELMEVAVICRSLWTRRNGFIHGKGFMHPNQVLSKALDEIEAYKSSQDHQSSCPASHGEGSASVWIQPLAGYYKLNWDVAINTARGLVGIGAILRDHMGRSIGTLQARRELNLNPFSGEAYALMMSVVFCKDIGVSNLVVEGDAIQVIRLLSGSVLDCSYGGLVVEDAKRELNTFATWSAIHTRREGNKAAHTLARNALTLSNDLLELELMPVCIQQIVRSEMSVMSF
ncbi:uncharacterized protein LOC122306382 [Carya illinoinensis]|uniref:uncharacterized protein LOC122306382 n=1 Tax=Carya illinoinensis TaxID=32201 RepID=UPI001C724098|nr:uncharacterized protein LOC122306382 [Carya illinoinensis]